MAWIYSTFHNIHLTELNTDSFFGWMHHYGDSVHKRHHVICYAIVPTLTHNWAGQQVESGCNELKYTSDIMWPYLLVFDLMLGELNYDYLFSTYVPLRSWRHMQSRRGLCFTYTWIFLFHNTLGFNILMNNLCRGYA